MTDDLIAQIVVQAPTVAILMYLLFRLDQRLGTLIQVICDLAFERDEETIERRLKDLR